MLDYTVFLLNILYFLRKNLSLSIKYLLSSGGNYMRKTSILIILCLFILVAASFTGAIQNLESGENISRELYENKVSIVADNFVKHKTIVQPLYSSNNVLGTDKQITSSEFDEENPVVDIGSDGNFLLLYHFIEDLGISSIGIQLSSDFGETWPSDLIWYLPSSNFNDASPINPDIGFMGDKVHAYGTNEILTEDPTLYLHDFVDIHNPDTWSIYSFDMTDSSSYVTETAIATNDTKFATGTIQDYEGTTDYYDDTLLIMWDTNGLEDLQMDSGVYWMNEEDGESTPYSHLSADAGDKTYFAFQVGETTGFSSIHSAYCMIDENTQYSDWRQSTVVGGKTYNCTNPDISVSGKKAYIVYNMDQNGNQDIYVATSTGGSVWMKYPIVESLDDELYPVVSANGDEVLCVFIKNGNLYKTSSKDAGKTWSEPDQVNEESDTVVEDFHFTDIKGNYGFWTDNRNGNADIYYDEIASAPILIIDEIKLGFGVKVTISNIGNAPAEDLLWSIDLVDGTILLGSQSGGTIDIGAGESKTVKSDFVFGFGRTSINVIAGDATKSTNGLVIGPFILAN